MIRLPLVRYECGCVGLEPSGPAKDHVVIVYNPNAREDHGDNVYLMDNQTAGHLGKPYEPLPSAEAAEITLELVRLIIDGHRFRQIRDALLPRDLAPRV